MSKDYNAGLDTAARIVEELIGDSPEGETILCGIESSKQINSENHYCETCGSCGETGCCSPINCETVKCKYGEINLKDYECTLKQWEIMFNALKIIVEECGGGKIGDYAKATLNAVEKEWDILYSKQ